MNNCRTCGKRLKHKDADTCSDCAYDFIKGIDRAREIWEYSEPRILSYTGDDWRDVRDEGYNTLLFTLFYCLRYARYADGKRVRTNLAPSRFQQIANEISVSRATINNNRYLQKRYQFLLDIGYITEIDENTVELHEYDPYCSPIL